MVDDDDDGIFLSLQLSLAENLAILSLVSIKSGDGAKSIKLNDGRITIEPIFDLKSSSAGDKSRLSNRNFAAIVGDINNLVFGRHFGNNFSISSAFSIKTSSFRFCIDLFTIFVSVFDCELDSIRMMIS
ncbi:hypothetical protein DERP_008029 [Dermatophagoides pteronyssinus]|uniref:Uncharacterized protein n=1 Tax=Dermatophagoides pteronyssinus TaxID=6956 RepID=A0ABQ8ITB2_DERPT|nr:hypothetical protein DERP_008029 [Dermatophagoides pteronyssinus]